MSNGRERGLSWWLALVTAGGCLAQVFGTCTGSPVTTEFYRSLGATEWHFGLLGGLPMMLLGMQFVGALMCNWLPRRKPLFVLTVIGGRLVFLGIAALPMLWPQHPEWRLVTLLVLLGLHHLLTNITVPLWFSWMGDLVPPRILNRYWGRRHQYMTLVWTVSYLTISFSSYWLMSWPVETVFRLLATIGVVAGVLDIVLFLFVWEPPNPPVLGRPVLQVLLEPWRDRTYRSFICFRCVWMFSAMTAAAFMQLYVLQELQVSLWQTNFIWCSAGLGAALAAGHWGRIADRHGTRPVIIICTALKPAIVLIFIFIDASTALLVLPFAFFLDSILNAGNEVPASGYMLKMAPAENRSMFIAAITALTGIAGGLGALTGGVMLDAIGERTWTWAGREWTAYHALFFASFLMRLVAWRMAFTIREPASTEPMTVLSFFRGSWPLRMMTFPVGLYRRRLPPPPDVQE